MIKQTFLRVVPGFVATLVAVFGMSATAFAQNPTAEQLDAIKQRCTSSQIALQQIEKQDAVSRINRGRDYDQMMRQVSAFNSRLAYNKISSPDLLQNATDLQNNIDQFRAAYDRYDTDISDAQKIDCRNKPNDFYQLVVKARTDRAEVGNRVSQIDETAGNYRSTILQYKDKVQ